MELGKHIYGVFVQTRTGGFGRTKAHKEEEQENINKK